MAVPDEQYTVDMEAIRHEFEEVWEAVNELQGIDPAKAGEPVKQHWWDKLLVKLRK